MAKCQILRECGGHARLNSIAHLHLQFRYRATRSRKVARDHDIDPPVDPNAPNAIIFRGYLLFRLPNELQLSKQTRNGTTRYRLLPQGIRLNL